MTNSFRIPFYKDKMKYFQRLHNRRERYKAKRLIRNKDYDTPTQRIVPTASYDIVDHIFSPYDGLSNNKNHWSKKQCQK